MINPSKFERIANGDRDYIPGFDDGEAPRVRQVEPYVCPDPEIEAMSEAELFEANEKAGIGH